VKRLVILAVCGLSIFSVRGYALDVELEKIVVTPNRYPQELNSTAAALSVITEEEIKDSGATDIVDLFRQEVGLLVRDYYGTGIKASIDIRGFGESADSNILVLLDGRRLNSIDLSGVDWRQIPLDRIARIEILRGGSGSVLYGDNAQAGVINIITKKGQAKPVCKIDINAGSYQQNKQELSLSGAKKNLSYDFVWDRFSTNGYRKNGYLETKDFSGGLSYIFSDLFSLGLSASYHEADFGLPGALLEADLARYSRRDTKYPDDDASEKDWYFAFNPKLDFQENGILEGQVSFRRRYMDTIWGSYLLFSSSNGSRIDTFGFCPRYILESQIAKHKNKLIAGLDFYKYASLTNDFDVFGRQTADADIHKVSLAGYLDNQFSLTEKLFLSLGYRYEYAKYAFDYTDLQGIYTDIDAQRIFKKNLYKIALAYNYQPDSKLFFNISRSFRFPMVEEFLLYDFSVFPFYRRINPDLKPQVSLNYEIGLEHAFGEKIKTGLTLYDMQLKNEIFFNPFTFTNENYKKTRHRGLELSLELKTNKKISFLANYTYTQALFQEGEFKHNTLPLVPRNKASVNLKITPLANLNFNLALNYVGERYFISDLRNAQERMPDYFTLDLSSAYSLGKAKIYFSINNICDKKYAEFGALSVFTGQKAFYPSAGRNFQAGISWEF